MISVIWRSPLSEYQSPAAVVGPLGLAGPEDLVGLRDPLLRQRARHVVTECARVDAFGAALTAGDLAVAGAVMDARRSRGLVRLDAVS